VDAVRREVARRGGDVAALAVDGLVRAEAADEVDAVASGRRGQHARAAQFRELESQHADVAARAVNDHALAIRDLQRIVYALQRGERDDRGAAGRLHIESPRNARHLARGTGDVLRVAAAVR